tara:strand:- start:6219 stop:6434 length:216 start_codon:yes stop_codon:yes gene_type:complete
MDNIKIIMNQTNYTHEQAIEALKKNNNDIEKTISEYLDVPPLVSPTLTTNQGIYTEIRNLLSKQKKSLTNH